MKTRYVHLASVLALGLVALGARSISAGQAGPPQEGWQAGNTADLPGLHVTLSKPVLVGRSKGYLWFPTVVRLSSGDLVAMMSDYADVHVAESTSRVAWSSDGGLTWGPLSQALGGDGSLALSSGDQLFMPYYLHPVGGGAMGARYQLCPKGERALKVVRPGVTIEGWPRPDKSFSPQLGLSGFVCNGQVVSLKDKGYLATLYGYFRDTSRYSLVASESSDGVRWTIRSVIADEKCELPGREGPCESAIVRLKDGRLLCVFRLDSGMPYGHSFSSDDGRTWTRPATLQGCFSVQPSLAVMPDGLVALSGGRPGLFLWLNADGTAATWHKIDVLANHNAHRPEEPIKSAGNTSSYTEVIPLDGSHLLYIYDRIPFGWSAIAPDSSETNSVWVVRVTLSRAHPAAVNRPRRHAPGAREPAAGYSASPPAAWSGAGCSLGGWQGGLPSRGSSLLAINCRAARADCVPHRTATMRLANAAYAAAALLPGDPWSQNSAAAASNAITVTSNLLPMTRSVCRPLWRRTAWRVEAWASSRMASRPARVSGAAERGEMFAAPDSASRCAEPGSAGRVGGGATRGAASGGWEREACAPVAVP